MRVPTAADEQVHPDRASEWLDRPAEPPRHADQGPDRPEKLSSDFNEAKDAFIDAVLGALQAGEVPLDLARAYLAYPVAMIHTDGARAVANCFERTLVQKPTIDWTPGG